LNEKELHHYRRNASDHGMVEKDIMLFLLRWKTTVGLATVAMKMRVSSMSLTAKRCSSISSLP
jgi:hypothetical protein